jgi:hypothetical protein
MLSMGLLKDIVHPKPFRIHEQEKNGRRQPTIAS